MTGLFTPNSCTLHFRSGILQAPCLRKDKHIECKMFRSKCLYYLHHAGTTFAADLFKEEGESAEIGLPRGDDSVNLTIWIPAMIFLGLTVFGLMFAFVVGCENV